MRYVLGAGISGLLWAFYHDDYLVLTDEFGRAVTGADPIVWLNSTHLTRRLLRDLGLEVVEEEKPIGYMLSGGLRVSYAHLSDGEVDQVLLKKMVPWEAIQAAGEAGFTVEVRTPRRQFTKDSATIRYLKVDLGDVILRLVKEVEDRVLVNRRVGLIDGKRIALHNLGELEYDHLVSTLPAPIFKRLWRGAALPDLHYAPVTFVVSRESVGWWDDQFAMIYPVSVDNPISRVGRFGNTWRYEITGHPPAEVVDALRPVSGGVFVHPYGRIIQDVKLMEPDPKIIFLGRAAEWDYRGLIDVTLERVHGKR